MGDSHVDSESMMFLKQVADMVIDHKLVGSEVREHNDSLVDFMSPLELGVRHFYHLLKGLSY